MMLDQVEVVSWVKKYTSIAVKHCCWTPWFSILNRWNVYIVIHWLIINYLIYTSSSEPSIWSSTPNSNHLQNTSDKTSKSERRCLSISIRWENTSEPACISSYTGIHNENTVNFELQQTVYNYNTHACMNSWHAANYIIHVCSRLHEYKNMHGRAYLS